MGAFKSIMLVITSACNVLVKLLSAAERGANSLDEATKGLEYKAKNFADLVKMNDEAEFNKRKAEIEKELGKLNLEVPEIKSAQEVEREEDAAAKAKAAEIEAKKSAEAKAAEDKLDV